MSSIQRKFGVTEELLKANGVLHVNEDEGANLDKIRGSLAMLAPLSTNVDLIRVGPESDGGYIIPNVLEGIEACFSPGVNNVKQFEDQLAEKYNIKSFMCDYSSDLKKFSTPLISSHQFFEKKWLDTKGVKNSICINDWIKRNSPRGSDLILQMDIEGAEYRNLLNASPDTLKRFRIVVVEIHGLGLLGDASFRNQVFNPTIKKLNETLNCVHLHPNNCCGYKLFSEDLIVPNVLEVTFLRKDFGLLAREKKLQIPNPLDAKNVTGSPDLHLFGILRGDAMPLQIGDVELRFHLQEVRLDLVERRLATLERRHDRRKKRRKDLRRKAFPFFLASP